ncbi:Transcriptional regulator, LacI family [Acidisarcina polymorpha]|uniref:Transcriptional regulator, LacI family n=2 Tax=Acidisarcina polymorpha TaxID=2211140 RepID=A0A2Z5G116_9BACT|nr:Transcriptional regulator, LacI family [Acidisarcina polymorpha]
MSVSRVVNGSRRVSPEVERKVRAAIEKIGYQPNEAARVLKGTRSSVLGLIVPDLADPFFAGCCNAIQEAAWLAGYMTLMVASAHREELERRETEMMVQRHVAGLIVVAVGAHNDHFAAAQNKGVPLVALDRPIENVQSDTITVDNFKAAVRATEHLIGHQHREIVCVADDERIYTKFERVSGYSRAMKEANLAPRVCLVGAMTGSVEEQVSLHLGSKHPPTAIFAASNVVCTEILHYLREHSMSIPEDLALICFDDFSAATLVTPPITVIQQPLAELGQTATRMMLDRLQNAGGMPSTTIELKTRLVLRNSCGCSGANLEAEPRFSVS